MEGLIAGISKWGSKHFSPSGSEAMNLRLPQTGAIAEVTAQQLSLLLSIEPNSVFSSSLLSTLKDRVLAAELLRKADGWVWIYRTDFVAAFVTANSSVIAAFLPVLPSPGKRRTKRGR